MIQFHVLESAIRPSDRSAGVLTPERVSFLDREYGHLAESVLEVIRNGPHGMNIGQDGALTAQQYEGLLRWLRLMLEQHVHELAVLGGRKSNPDDVLQSHPANRTREAATTWA